MQVGVERHFVYVIFLIFLARFHDSLGIMPNVSQASNMMSLATFGCSLENGMTALAACLSVRVPNQAPSGEGKAKPFTPSSVSYKLKAFLRLSFQKCICCSSRPLYILYIFQVPLHVLRQNHKLSKQAVAGSSVI